MFEVVELFLVVDLVPVEPVVLDLLPVEPALETPVLDETVGSPKGRSSCAARAELVEGLTNVAPAGVLTLIEVFDLLVAVFRVLEETVGSPKQRSSCAARAELRVGFTQSETELGFATDCFAETDELLIPIFNRNILKLRRAIRLVFICIMT